MSQPDDFDRSMDRLGNSVEKNVDKAVNAIEKGANVVNKVQQGCMAVLVNLFLCAFFGWGVFAAFNALQVEGREQATATVVELKESNDPELGRRYTSVVEYQADGRAYTAEVGEPSIPAEHAIGDTLEIRYDGDDPSEAVIDDPLDRWLFPALIIPAMLITAGILDFLILRAWRRGEDFDFDDE